jgi:hypothetical protein
VDTDGLHRPALSPRLDIRTTPSLLSAETTVGATALPFPESCLGAALSWKLEEWQDAKRWLRYTSAALDTLVSLKAEGHLFPLLPVLLQ